MSNFLVGPLNEMFGRPRKARAEPMTRVIATLRALDGSAFEQEVTKGANGLWSVAYEGVTLRNSRLGDLIEQIEREGGTVERRAI